MLVNKTWQLDEPRDDGSYFPRSASRHCFLGQLVRVAAGFRSCGLVYSGGAGLCDGVSGSWMEFNG